MTALNPAHPKRNIPAAITLFFVAPLVAEFLLGNLTLKLLPAMIVLAPLYGGGAILIRETVRRAHRGWPSILLLGAAYTLIEEGFATQSLFNPDYLRLQMHLLDHAWIPALGIGAWWTLFMFNVHALWSISVSIALVEGLFPSPAPSQPTPWLGPIGDAIFALLFLAGVIATCRFTLQQEHFLASPAQLLGVGAFVLLLIALAFLLPFNRPRTSQSPVPSAVPSPLLTSTFAFLLGFGILIVPSYWNWGAVAAILAIDLLFLASISALASRAGWLPLHTFSLGAGGALAYGIHAFFETPAAGGSGTIVRAGNVLFLAAALALIAAGARRSSQVSSEP